MLAVGGPKDGVFAEVGWEAVHSEAKAFGLSSALQIIPCACAHIQYSVVQRQREGDSHSLEHRQGADPVANRLPNVILMKTLRAGPHLYFTELETETWKDERLFPRLRALKNVDSFLTFQTVPCPSHTV